MNPLAHLLPALLAALTAPPLTWDGTAVPVYQHVGGRRAGHYVLLTQPTAASAPGTAACKQWSCTATLDVVTQFATELVSSLPAEGIATELTNRLEGLPRLQLPPGYQCGPAVLELHQQLPLGVEGLFGVRRLLRYRWDIFYHA